MIGFENRKGQDLQKPFPGCVGKMINIFDLSSGMPRTKLVTDKPHRDDSPSNKNRSDMEKKRQVVTVGVEDKLVTNDRWRSSSKKSGGTPMKMLIAQELLREKESRQKPTNVVARLMGLDVLPVQQSELTPKRSLQEGYSHNFSSGELWNYRQVEGGSGHRPLQLDTPSCNHEKKYKDVYEVRQQPARVGRLKDQPQRKGGSDENATEKRMELIRQKFKEAKRLATDERLLQSKEFQDVLEVLSSNRDLFLKFLEEPNSLISKHFHGIQHAPPSQIKRITVLRPSNATATKDEVAIKSLYPVVENINHNMNMNQRNAMGTIFIPHKAENSQTTRIVVLKPSPGTPNETKTTSFTAPKQTEGRDFSGSLGTDEAIESRELAKKITRQMQQYLSSERRDEALLSSSALSNGYVGDESSFNRSENEFNGEGCCNISDSEVVTPTSRHSWDYNNRFGSPCSTSSFSRESCSPEPSVIREAKKRLSERWAVMASNGSYQGQNQMQRSSSTLGDLLAIPEVKKEEGSDDHTISRSCSCDGEQDIKASVGCFSTSGVKVGCGEDSAKNLLRSKSLPVSSSIYENIELKVAPNPLTSKTVVPKEVAKLKTGVSSFKGKVSSFFFSRSKKSGLENDIPPASDGSDNRLNSAEASCEGNEGSSESFRNSNSNDGILTYSEEKCRGASTFANSLNGQKHANPSAKASCSLENQNEPSPISVLEAQFEEDANNISRSSLRAISVHPQALSRSQLIESVSRTLTWDSPHLGGPLSNSSKLSRILSEECGVQERFAFVQKLLSSASLVDSGDCTVLARWHSLDSPLDPMLLDEFLDRDEEAAKCRERRSNQRLLFDCVNAALLDTGWSTLNARACGQTWQDGKKCALVAEEVWRLVRDWFSSEEDNQESGQNEDSVVEELVKREVAGSGWAESMCSEIDEFGKEIGGEVLEELVKELVADLTDVCL